jgi:C1A family cysteine protease
MKTNFLFNLFASFCVLTSASIRERFNEWAYKHNISPSEHVYNNWVNNDKYITEKNNKNLTYTLDHNAYSGYSLDEFSDVMGFGPVPLSIKMNDLFTFENTALPTSVDWRSKGVVNAVKDQGQCGSCWAFSTICSVESAVAIKTGVLNVLSEQQLVDCDNLKNGGKDYGCNGGLMDNAFTWIGKNNGVCSSKSYPYVSGTTKTSGTCQKTCTNVVNTDVSRFVDVQVNSDSAMMTALAQQPVSVAIEADQRDFQLYSSGVFTSACGTNLDHGVVLVGYGAMNGLDYYILRNSWGTSWGSSGYMYLGRGTDPSTGKLYNNGAGQCGVLGEGSYPVV